MKIAHQNLWLSLLLITITSTSVYFIFSHGLGAHSKSMQNHLNGYLENASYLQYNKAGKLVSHLSTPIVQHYSFKSSSIFKDPDILIYSKQQNVPWHITAKQGKSIQGTDTIDLWDEVVIHRDATERDAETTIRTTAATLHLQKQEAETEQAVTITQPHSVTQSVGLRADFKTGVMQLSSHARGVYEATHSEKPEPATAQPAASHELGT